MTLEQRIKYQLGMATIPLVHRLWHLFGGRSEQNRVILDRNVFVIASTISPSSSSSGDAASRLHFSPRERFTQTMASADSIRARVPDGFIILLENSHLGGGEVDSLRKAVDWLITFDSDPMAATLRDHPNKGAGEVYMLRTIQRILSGFRYRKLFKLSGRYRLSANFKLESFPTTRFGYLRRDGAASTRLYSVPFALHRLWGRQLTSTLLAARLGVGIETSITRGLKATDIEWLNHIGVEGHMGDGTWLAE